MSNFKIFEISSGSKLIKSRLINRAVAAIFIAQMNNIPLQFVDLLVTR